MSRERHEPRESARALLGESADHEPESHESRPHERAMSGTRERHEIHTSADHERHERARARAARERHERHHESREQHEPRARKRPFWTAPQIFLLVQNPLVLEAKSLFQKESRVLLLLMFGIFGSM